MTILGKLEIPLPLDRFIAAQLETNGFGLLPLGIEHAGAVAGLPFHHRDPFDRLLVTQALREKMSIVSADKVFRRYGVKRIW